MSIRNVRGSLSQTGDSLVIKYSSAGTTKLTITHPANNTAARALTLPDVDYDYTLPDVKGTGDVTFDSTAAAYRLTIDSTNLTAARTWTLQDAADTFVGRATTDTLLNKTLTSPVLNGVTTLSVQDNGSNDMIIASSDGAFSADRTLNFDLNDGDKTIDLAGNFTTAGAYALTLTQTATTNVTLPTTGTLATLAGAETFTNKTATALQITAGSTIDTDGAGTLGIGNTNATTITLGQSGQTVVVAGNLTVSGTTTTLNTTTLDVADVNITVNNGGNQTSADGNSGLTVEMSDATDVTLLYDSTLTSRWKIGDSGSESEVITAAGTQTITGNKTFSGTNSFSGSNTFTADIEVDNQQAINLYEQDGNGSNYIALKAPDAVTTTTEFKLPDGDGTANQVMVTDGSGNLTWATQSGGGVGINLIENGNAKDALDQTQTNDVQDWIDSSTGTASSKTTTSSEIPLYPDATTAIKIAFTNSLEDYTRVRFTMPEALKNTKLGISWYQMTDGTNYANNDARVELYYNASSDYTGAYTEVALADDNSSGDSYIPATNGRYINSFDEGGNDYYELRIYNEAATGGNEWISLNDVTIGPGVIGNSAALGPWTSDNLTYTAGFGTVASENVKWRQSGDAIELRGSLALGTATTDQPYFTLPNSYNLSTTNLDALNTVLGVWWKVEDTGSPAQVPADGFMGVLVYDGTNTDRVYFSKSSASDAFVLQGTTSSFATGDFIAFQLFPTPIDELEGKGTVNTLVEDNLKLVGEGDTGSTTWDGTAPTGTVTSKYRWARTGNTIDFWWRYDASTQGSTNSTVSFTLPSDVPAPATFSTDGGNEWLGFQGSGTMANSVASSGAGAGFAALRQVGGVTQVYVDREAATNAAYASCHIRFITSETITQNSLVGFSDATTTKSGLRKAEKQYIGGTDVTVTSNAAATVDFKRSVFVPYQTYDGAWRMKFNIVVFHGSDASHSITVSGVTFKNTTSYNQACDCVGNAMQAARAFAQPNASTIFVQHAAAVTETYVSGDVELDSKPTWAD